MQMVKYSKLFLGQTWPICAESAVKPQPTLFLVS